MWMRGHGTFVACGIHTREVRSWKWLVQLAQDYMSPNLVAAAYSQFTRRLPPRLSCAAGTAYWPVNFRLLPASRLVGESGRKLPTPKSVAFGLQRVRVRFFHAG